MSSLTKDIIAEAICEMKLSITNEQIFELAESIVTSLSCINDMEYEMCGGRDTAPVIDYKKLYNNTLAELETYKKECNIYQESVARRNNVDKSCIKIEDDHVMIYP